MGIETDLALALCECARALEIHVIHGKKGEASEERRAIDVLVGIVEKNQIGPEMIKMLEAALRLPLLEHFHVRIKRILAQVPAREKEVALSNR